MDYPIIVSDAELMALRKSPRIDGNKLAAALEELRVALATHLNQGPPIGNLKLDQLVLSLSITAGAELAFVSASASISATASITLAFSPAAAIPPTSSADATNP